RRSASRKPRIPTVAETTRSRFLSATGVSLSARRGADRARRPGRSRARRRSTHAAALPLGVKGDDLGSAGRSTDRPKGSTRCTDSRAKLRRGLTVRATRLCAALRAARERRPAIYPRTRPALSSPLHSGWRRKGNIVESFASAIQTQKKEAKAAVSPAVRATQFSTGIKFGNQANQNYSVPKVEEGPLYSYTPIRQQIEGPSPPNWRELQARGYVSHIRNECQVDRAGGFRAHVACLRALQEAMAGLYHNPSQRQAEFGAV
ncbi:Cdk-activating kinase assembly factor mat1-like protein, partial [Temnothorax longispinosus]